MDVQLVQQAAGQEEEVIGRGSSGEMIGEEKCGFYNGGDDHEVWING
jgi:hypothetical protein